MDGVVVPGSPSSPSSNSTDSDAVNTSSAKIYFGQFTSPEKKLAALVDKASSQEPNELNVGEPGPSSLLRRSPRLSSPPARNSSQTEIIEQSEQEEEDEEDEARREDGSGTGATREGSWQDTPYLEFLRKDEPSSAIASRIMRAHDNPSPPPKPLRKSLTPRLTSKLAKELVFPSIPSSAESSDAAIDSPLQPVNEGRDIPTPPPLLLADVSTLPTPTTQRVSSRSPTSRRTTSSSPPKDPEPKSKSKPEAEVDLISFDRSVLISSPNEIEIRSPSPRRAQQQTVDDLLFSSPLQSASPRAGPREIAEEDHTIKADGLLLINAAPQVQENKEEHVPQLEKVETVDDAPATAYVPETSDTASQSSDSDHPEVSQAEVQKTPVARLVVPDPSPSLRRSPRLSAIPLPVPQDTTQLSTPGRPPKVKAPRSEGSQTRKRRRSSSGRTTRASLSPKKSIWPVVHDGSDNETELLPSPSRSERRERKRAKRCTEGPSDTTDVQLAESLSPGSAFILSKLVSLEDVASSAQVTQEAAAPVTPQRSGATVTTEDKEMAAPEKPLPLPSISSVQRPPPGVFPSHIVTPARGSSTTRPFLAPSSPIKLNLASSLNDPNRTPARRIPIKDANDTSRPNISNASQSNTMRIAPNLTRPPVFTRPPPTDNPERSPAKRIPISELPHSTSKSTSRPKVFEPSINAPSSNTADAEPPITKTIVVESKPVSKGRTASASTSKPALREPAAKRVFVVPSKTTTASSSSSSASKTESRIPRPGAASAKRTSKLPLLSTRKPSSSTITSNSRLPSPAKAPVPKVPRLQRNNSSSGSDDSGSGQARGSGTGPTRPLNGSTAKRKRETEKPTPAQPLIKVRQVVRGMYGGPVKPIALNGVERPSSEDQQHPPSSPVKSEAPPRQIRPRLIVKGTLQDFELTSHAEKFKTLEALNEERARERAEQEKVRREEEERAKREVQKEPSPAPCLETFTFECTAPAIREDRMDVDPQDGGIPTSDSMPPSDDANNTQLEDSQRGFGARRSSRARRPASSDVFGTVASTVATSQPAPRRKLGTASKPRASTLPPNLIFSTNGVALKTLTNNNTARNQHYHTQLETLVIRKAGERPESPTMKLRTISEKQKEDQDKSRDERARRRRGTGESDVSGDIDMEESIDVHPLKHRRGPGDEEDYETPVRPSDGRKAVKWDRGLEVSAFLDEIEVQPRKYRAGEGAAPRKGCLSAGPNRVALDNLGNPVNAEAPLELAPEKVLVTKYVYDNDEEALLFAPPPAKTTRSKTKKK